MEPNYKIYLDVCVFTKTGYSYFEAPSLDVWIRHTHELNLLGVSLVLHSSHHPLLIDRNSIWFVLLGHNRVVWLSTENRNERGCTGCQRGKPKYGKNHGSPRTAKYHYERITKWGIETTISCSLASPTGGYNRGNVLFLSHTLSHSTHLRTLYTYITLQQLYNISHIYTHITFRLFTHIAPGASLERIHICVPSSRSGEVTTGPSIIRFSSHPEGPVSQQWRGEFTRGNTSNS